MKTIGLLGGMSWESTQSYYRLINEGVRDRLGGLHSARVLLLSVDFAEIEVLQQHGDWDACARLLGEAALKLQAAGAECLLICTNTMHRVAAEISQTVRIPLLHIADATAALLDSEGISRAALLGTAFTMEQEFYRQRLEAGGRLEILIPEAEDRQLVHQCIYQELCRGIFRPESKSAFLQVIDRLAARGAEAVILGCTEIGILIGQSDTSVRLVDTTAVHASSAVDFALS